MEHNPNHLIDIINKNNLNEEIKRKESINRELVSDFKCESKKEKKCNYAKDKLKICLENDDYNSKKSNSASCFNLLNIIVENCGN